MVDIDGKLEETDIDFIQGSIENNGLNISKSIDKLTKELRMYNLLKLIELDLAKSFPINYKGLSKQAKETIDEYFGD